ncbi:MAG TPA: phosphatidate cytidylyltransferase [Anaerolineales bacterium]|nr:phosphatidate cytidylyltransferase [Anaerolineales bacterium]
MLRQRVLVAAVLLPVGLWIFSVGGWLYAAAMALVLGLAAAEYARLFRFGGSRPAAPLIVAGTVGLALARHAWRFEFSDLLLAGSALAVMGWHLVDYERGAPSSATDFGISLGGLVYLGFVGAFLVSLRDLPEGWGWLLISLPAVWIGDSAAYFVGRAIGRHKMSPRLSPNKSWEGYAAGIVAAALGGALMAFVYVRFGGAGIVVTPGRGLILGLVLGLITPLGDLGISMMKRQFRVKDTGTLLPGHGGVLDRIDSWLWAGVLGYYLTVLMIG